MGRGAESTATAGIPKKLGEYEILGRLAAGGMAEIFVGRLTRPGDFEKFVVVKKILPHLAHDQEFIDMFLAEARIAAQLVHPNIIQVFDVGRDGASYFYAMEYIHGEDLRTLSKAASAAGQSIPLEIAIAIGRATASALHHAHTHVGPDGRPLGIVHRDVSPTNVLVGYDGSIKLLDFGIAKIMDQTGVTREGVRKGKLAYMSPEQCRGEPVDPRSDVFSLGIVLHELTTMRRLFDAGDDFAAMYRIVAEDVPPPSARRSDYPRQLERIVLKALRRDRKRRYQSAAELLDDLERFAHRRGKMASQADVATYMAGLMGQRPLPWTDPAMGAGDDEPTVAEPVPGTWKAIRRRRLLVAVGGVAAAAAVIAAGAQLLPSEEATPEETLERTAPPVAEPTPPPAQPPPPAVAPAPVPAPEPAQSGLTAEPAPASEVEAKPARGPKRRKRGRRAKPSRGDESRTKREQLDAFLPGS